MRIWLFVFLISLVAAYVFMPCEAPKEKIGLVCCLDLNDNQICDSNEISTSGAGCKKPYIFDGTSCCLDINENGICDKDEQMRVTDTTMAVIELKTQQTSSTSSSTSISSSTSLIETSTTYSTTTTTQVDPKDIAKLVGCYDSDGGENHGVAGVTVGKNRLNSEEIIEKKDVCLKNDVLREFRCQGDTVYSKDVLCDSQRICELGRCCIPEGGECLISADCCSNTCIKKNVKKLCD